MDYLDEQPSRLQPRSQAPKPIESWNARDLYRYLQGRAEPYLRIQLMQKPLLKNFRSWLDSGLTPVQVRAMLDAFLNQEDWHRVHGYPAWRILIARKGDLVSMVVRTKGQEEAEAHRYDEDYWIGTD